MAVLDQYKNLALAVIATPPSPATTGTSLTVTAGQAAWLPPPPFNATVFDPKVLPTPANAEIVRVTAVAGNTLTIARTQEGSAARTIVAGDNLAATFTVKFVSDVTDAQNLTGAIADARLSANIPRLASQNQFTTHQYLVYAAPQWIFWDSAQATDQRAFRLTTSGQQFAVRAANDAMTTDVASPLSLDRSGNAKIGADLYEKGRATPLGHWLDVPFNAANYTADTGTVGAITQLTYAYALVGRTCHLNLYATFTPSAATASVYVALPAGVVAARVHGAPFYTNAATAGAGLLTTTAGGSTLRLLRDVTATPWSAGMAVYAAAALAISI
jgi:hypothetical protein